jgi:hypothetical protein
MEAMAEVDQRQGESESVFARVAGRFARADLRRRMRDYLRGLLAPVGHLIVAVGKPVPGNRNDCRAWEESGAKAAVGTTPR